MRYLLFSIEVVTLKLNSKMLIAEGLIRVAMGALGTPVCLK